MRLIKTHSLGLEDFTGCKVPPYAILSHTWETREVTCHDLLDLGARTTLSKKDMRKIREICRIAAADKYDYVWIDSCCIDKSNNTELAEAINSMFQWYANAAVCYAYICDYVFCPPISTATFGSARWFNRGWTLQELIAPANVKFYDINWTLFGTKRSLQRELSAITGIDKAVLSSNTPDEIRSLIAKTTVSKKMSWAAGRQTTREEDLAYCLLGIFDVNMPLLYGERSKAFSRLQEEIIKNTNDLTLFAWQAAVGDDQQLDANQHTTSSLVHYRGVLASHPNEFADTSGITGTYENKINPEFSLTNKGLRINASLQRCANGHFFIPLNCYDDNSPSRSLGIYLEYRGSGTYVRAHPDILPLQENGPLLDPNIIYITKHMAETTMNSRNQVYLNALVFNIKLERWPVQFVSVEPESLWQHEQRMFVTYGTQNFIGVLHFIAKDWVSYPNHHQTSRFVVACGLSEKSPRPWITIDHEEKEIGETRETSFWAGKTDYFTVKVLVEHGLFEGFPAFRVHIRAEWRRVKCIVM
ncbi:heterokaryon incompatibility protein-domain-containing protein [Xylariaceae sp. FL1651]|nr:heterokaryon incompatibility protein-domain-containing protein [Xylariaceae sp. FL1651]